MTRQRASDHTEKASRIVEQAASVFASVGYPNARMQDIAAACGASKSMLYHYFPTKDDLLFAMLNEHLQEIIGAIEDVIDSDGSAETKLVDIVRAYLLRSTESRQRHVAAMNDMKFLPDSMQASLRELERQIATLIGNVLRELHPSMPPERCAPSTMILLGMLNWTDYWFRTDGALNADDLCALITRIFLHGFMNTTGADAV